jgi:mRNA-degrading endonuclease RelE of RelBE toxin-antitoxin system
MTSKPPIQVEYTARFKKDLKRLHKKYRRVSDDVADLLQQLESGETPGDQIPGVKYTVYKVRLKSSDLTKGKSGGFRVIYYVQTAERIFLITMYVKSEQSDVSPVQIKQVIEELEPSEG